jgi:hypothetical protein
MANGNSGVWKALGIIGLMVGLIGGSIGLASTLGPGKDVTRHETAIGVNTVTIAAHSARISVLEAAYVDIKAALVRIEAKMDKDTP